MPIELKDKPKYDDWRADNIIRMREEFIEKYVDSDIFESYCETEFKIEQGGN